MEKRLRCPKCGHIFNTLIDNDTASIYCPHCRHQVNVIEDEIELIRRDKMINKFKNEGVSHLIESINNCENDLKLFIKKAKIELSERGYSYRGTRQIRGKILVQFENGKDAILGKANCNPDDHFNWLAGEALAMERVLKRVIGDDFEI